jgi:hypothetical protein
MSTVPSLEIGDHNPRLSRECYGTFGHLQHEITGWWLTYPSEKWSEKSVGIITVLLFPTEWKNQTCSKPPTSIYMYVCAMNDIKIGCARNTKTLVTLDGQ